MVLMQEDLPGDAHIASYCPSCRPALNISLSAYYKSRHGIDLPSCRIYTFASFCGALTAHLPYQLRLLYPMILPPLKPQLYQMVVVRDWQ